MRMWIFGGAGELSVFCRAEAYLESAMLKE